MPVNRVFWLLKSSFLVFRSSFWVFRQFFGFLRPDFAFWNRVFSFFQQNLAILCENLDVLAQNNHQIWTDFFKNRVFCKLQIEFLEKIEFLEFWVNRVFAKMLKKTLILRLTISTTLHFTFTCYQKAILGRFRSRDKYQTCLTVGYWAIFSYRHLTHRGM